MIAIAFIAACGGDSPTQQTEGPSAAQANSMAAALSTLIVAPLGDTMASANKISARIFSSFYAGSADCQAGGHVGARGDYQMNSTLVIYLVQDTLVSCALRDEHQNVWTFTSRPTLQVSIVDSLQSGSFDDPLDITEDQSQLGNLDYSNGSISGSLCNVYLVTHRHTAFHQPTSDSATLSVRTKGGICGRTIDTDTSFTIYTPPAP